MEKRTTKKAKAAAAAEEKAAEMVPLEPKRAEEPTTPKETLWKGKKTSLRSRRTAPGPRGQRSRHAGGSRL